MLPLLRRVTGAVPAIAQRSARVSIQQGTLKFLIGPLSRYCPVAEECRAVDHGETAAHGISPWTPGPADAGRHALSLTAKYGATPHRALRSCRTASVTAGRDRIH